MTEQNWEKTSESKPESEVPVIVFVRLPGGKTRRLRAMWIPRWTVEAGDSETYEYLEGKDEYFILEGWYERNEFDEDNWHIDGEVTHWMPLPEPPEE
jgi:hypothetical protein